MLNPSTRGGTTITTPIQIQLISKPAPEQNVAQRNLVIRICRR